MTYPVIVAPTAVRMLDAITDRRVRELIQARIRGLANEPEKQGKALGEELAGYRSVRAAGQRYRILYRVERDKVVVLVVAVGIRKEGSRADVYEAARRLVRLGLLGPIQN